MSHQSELIATDIHAYLAQHERKEMLRFLTCGSVDDGKSTLIGRMLFDSKMVYEDQLAALEVDSKRFGTTGGQFDPALLTDGLRAEREQGITIDVAYRYFSTAKRKFIIADTPGHEQYTRNMVTGASTCDLAIILIDARHGVQVQTRRHSFIASLLGIKHIVVAVNKMDLVDWSEDVFDKIKADYADFAAKLELSDIRFVPISALAGDNVIHPSDHMPWYSGSTLMHILENVVISADRNLIDFRFPVQFVNRPDLNFRGFCGTVASGIVRPGDEVMVLPSKKTSRVARVVTMDGDLDEAFPPQSVTLTLEDQIDASRGDMIVHPGNQPRVGRAFEAMLVWMAEEPMQVGGNYLIKHTTRTSPGVISALRYRMDVNSLHRHDAPRLELNEIGRAVVELQRPLAFDPYQENPPCGAFIVIDRLTHNTVAAGMILEHDPQKLGGTHRRDLFQAPVTVERHESHISAEQREAKLGHQPATVWLTGLTGAGKSAIAYALEERLFNAGYLCHVLDGRNARLGISVDLNFTDDDRAENNRRAAEVAKLFNEAGLISICAFMSPHANDRQWAKGIVEKAGHRFYEVYCEAPEEAVSQRVEAAKAGNVDTEKVVAFSDLDSPFEVPENPALTLKTAELTLEQSVDQLMDLLSREGVIR
ncbi:MAG: sulfate adenylyltransferase subunit CysN [Planctomycetes bacterium]|jgi:bifunctional enzyme CysN/CysC|nr:sulfate adenylyltransferase subunit CysN [Planctomycetota bacterium]